MANKKSAPKKPSRSETPVAATKGRSSGLAAVVGFEQKLWQAVDKLLRLSELRPEFSWFGPHVETDVAATLCRMVLLAELNGQEASA